MVTVTAIIFLPPFGPGLGKHRCNIAAGTGGANGKSKLKKRKAGGFSRYIGELYISYKPKRLPQKWQQLTIYYIVIKKNNQYKKQRVANAAFLNNFNIGLNFSEPQCCETRPKRAA